MARGGVSLLALSEIALGVILAWSGIENQTLTATLGNLVRGKAPTPGPAGPPSSTSSSSASSTSSAAAPPSGAPGAVNGCTVAETATNQELGRILAAPYGWAAGAQWNALNGVVMLESGWCNVAQNPGSTAYGIGQFLDSTWASVGAVKTSSAPAQIAAMLRYIKERYGTPEAAYSFHIANGYY